MIIEIPTTTTNFLWDGRYFRMLPSNYVEQEHTIYKGKLIGDLPAKVDNDEIDTLFNDRSSEFCLYIKDNFGIEWGEDINKPPKDFGEVKFKPLPSYMLEMQFTPTVDYSGKVRIEALKGESSSRIIPHIEKVDFEIESIKIPWWAVDLISNFWAITLIKYLVEKEVLDTGVDRLFEVSGY